MTTSLDGTARIWEVAAAKELAAFGDHTDYVIAASFYADGAQVVTVSENGSTQIWDAVSGDKLEQLKLQGDPAASWPSSERASRRLRRRLPHPILEASFGADGTQLVTASLDGTVRIWDVASGLQWPALQGHTDLIYTVSFSADGTRVVTASGDFTARIWEVASGVELASLKGHRAPVVAASFGPNGARVVTASRDGIARIWDATSGVELATLDGHMLDAIAPSFNLDGTHVVAAFFGSTARIWDVTSGLVVATLTGHTNVINAASYSPDGTRVVTASADGTARVWDALLGVELATLEGHTDEVLTASFSADGTRIITTSADGMARIWLADVEMLQVAVRERTSLCLEPAFREQTLGETPREAQRIYQACQRCLRTFWQARSVSSFDQGLEALREYKQCARQ